MEAHRAPERACDGEALPLRGLVSEEEPVRDGTGDGGVADGLHREMWGDVGRCGEISGGIGRCGEIYGA